uniref:response regulator transcription factor n=1 Tax=uncultured Enterococcus sp. TaxID=167972 RepID=UPI0025FF0907
MKQSILLVEDDEKIIAFMEVILTQEHYQLHIAMNASEALMMFQTNTIDLVLLDLGLPDMDGIELLKIIRQQMSLPILILSARTNELEKVKALDLGADDYITKPFGTQELLARIRTATRRNSLMSGTTQSIENKDLRIDFDKKLVYKENQEIHLTKNEYRILEVMFLNIGKIVNYQTLVTSVWGPYAEDQKTLRVNVSNIRKKIEEQT